jgi:hypothetical protein
MVKPPTVWGILSFRVEGRPDKKCPKSSAAKKDLLDNRQTDLLDSRHTDLLDSRQTDLLDSSVQIQKFSRVITPNS